ncbi:MAG: DUF502 domain-containing protein [Cyclobacteriaceae bacterium]|nr:DUF502 domain-containing protein [Cyclobacteriaceae bacterium]
MKKLTSYFFQGLLYLAPISITIYVIYLVFDFSDNLLQEHLSKLIGREVPGLGVLIMLVFLTALGYIGQTIIARPFKLFFYKIIHTIPLLELIYSAIKDFFSAFVGKDKKFNKPVMFKVNPTDHVFRLGFITNTQLKALGLSDTVAVYVPFSYTFTGETYLVSKDAIKIINVPASEVMKFIVAGGVADIVGNEKNS